jgi:hypothetical protein
MYYLITLPTQGRSRIVLHNENIDDLIHHYRMRFTNQKAAIVESRKYLNHSAYIKIPKCNKPDMIKGKHSEDFFYAIREV